KLGVYERSHRWFGRTDEAGVRVSHELECDPAHFRDHFGEEQCGLWLFRHCVSGIHREQPYIFRSNGAEYRVDYEPAESSTGLFGGNSNWRGPIWFPVSFLLIESLQKFHHYFGDEFKVECPTGSGRMMTLWEVAAELSRRLTRIF